MSADVTHENEAIRAVALDWVIRSQQEDFAGWDDLTDWMIADPRHAESFNRQQQNVADAIDTLHDMPPAELLRGEVPPPAAVPVPDRQWMRWAAGLLLPIAAVGAMFAYQRAGPGRARPMLAIQTNAGEQHDVTLPDGTRIALAGSTRLSYDPGGRQVRLEAGHATFRVTHDAGHPFSVRIGDALVTDVGTVFDIHRDGSATDIAVAEGAIRVADHGEAVILRAGQQLRLAGASMGAPQPIAPRDAGGVRHASLTFPDITVAALATELQAATGAPIRATPSVADHHFSGTILIQPTAEQTLRTIAPLLRVSVGWKDGAWELDSPGSAARR